MKKGKNGALILVIKDAMVALNGPPEDSWHHDATEYEIALVEAAYTRIAKTTDKAIRKQLLYMIGTIKNHVVRIATWHVPLEPLIQSVHEPSGFTQNDLTNGSKIRYNGTK